MFSKKSMYLTLAFILLVALATLGLSYGAWTETLNINGNVSTGSLDVDFIGTDGGVTDVDPLNLVTCLLDYEDDLVTITISGAYPGYQCNPIITVKNTGTVPAVATLNFPASEPVHHVYVGGVSMGDNLLAPGGSVGFTLPIEVYLDPPMNTPITFTFPIPVVQQP